MRQHTSTPTVFGLQPGVVLQATQHFVGNIMENGWMMDDHVPNTNPVVSHFHDQGWVKTMEPWSAM